MICTPVPLWVCGATNGERPVARHAKQSGAESTTDLTPQQFDGFGGANRIIGPWAHARRPKRRRYLAISLGLALLLGLGLGATALELRADRTAAHGQQKDRPSRWGTPLETPWASARDSAVPTNPPASLTPTPGPSPSTAASPAVRPTASPLEGLPRRSR